MLRVEIPGFQTVEIAHLVCDYNGTLAEDGHLIPGVAEKLRQVAERVTIHVVTADTFGRARQELVDLPCTCIILPPGDQSAAKGDFVRQLGAPQTAAIGNGRNDQQMLQEAVIGIAVLNAEGAAAQTLLHAAVVCRHIHDALQLLLEPRRLIATLRA